MEVEKIYIFKNNRWEDINKRPNSKKNSSNQRIINKQSFFSLFFITNLKISENEINDLLNAIFNEKELNKKDFKVYFRVYKSITQEENLSKKILESSICIFYCENIIDNIQYIKTIEDIIFNYKKIENIPFKIIIEKFTEELTKENFKSPHCFLYENNEIKNIIARDELKILKKDENLKKKENFDINPSYAKNIINFKPKFSIFLDKTNYQIKLSISFPYYEDNNEEQVKIKTMFLYTRIFDYYFYLFGERNVDTGKFDFSNIDKGSFGISFSLPFTIFEDIIVLKFKLIKEEYKKKEGIYEIIYEKETYVKQQNK